MNALALTGLLLPAAPTLAPIQDSAALSSATAQTAAPDGLFPPASEDLALAWPGDSEGLTLLDVVGAYGEITGQRLAIRASTIEWLRGRRAPIDRPTSIPAAEVQGFVEAMLRSEDVVMTIDRAQEPRLVGVHSLEVVRGFGIRSRALAVGSDETELLRDHPALLFSTVVDLPHLDVRSVSNSLRTLIVDANTQQILPAGNASSLVLVGFGPALADLIDQLREIDASSVDDLVSVSHELIRLENAVAADVAPIVEAALSTSREIRSRVPFGQQQPQRPPVLLSVVPDLRLNALLVTCRGEDIDEARRVIAEVDAK